VPYTFDAREAATLRLPAGTWEKASFRKGKGCEACRGTGYHGRVGCFELLTVDDEVRRLVQARSTAAEIHAVARQAGMHSLFDDGMAKVAAGVTTFEELLRVSTKGAL
jgi:general secretion pathway protein E